MMNFTKSIFGMDTSWFCFFLFTILAAFVLFAAYIANIKADRAVAQAVIEDRAFTHCMEGCSVHEHNHKEAYQCIATCIIR